MKLFTCIPWIPVAFLYSQYDKSPHGQYVMGIRVYHVHIELIFRKHQNSSYIFGEIRYNRVLKRKICLL